ncbi:MAG: hypothetical protein AB7R89_10085 [Dehalococcoidia bacterium]
MPSRYGFESSEERNARLAKVIPTIESIVVDFAASQGRDWASDFIGQNNIVRNWKVAGVLIQLQGRSGQYTRIFVTRHLDRGLHPDVERLCEVLSAHTGVPVMARYYLGGGWGEQDF